MKNFVATVALAVVGGVGFGQAAVQKRPMTFADLMAMKRVSDPQVSASGKWVRKPKNSELWYKTVGDWCNKWTKQ